MNKHQVFLFFFYSLNLFYTTPIKDEKEEKVVREGNG